MCGEVKLTWNHGNIVIGNRPLIVVLPFVKVHEVTDHPEVASSIRVCALVKILHPFGICLTADPDTL